MKFKYNFLLVLALSVGLVSCQNEDYGIQGNGEVVEEAREIGAFDKVIVNGPFKVTIVEGDSDELTISGESNILPYIDTTVRDGYLMIEPNYQETLYVNKPLIVSVSTNALVEIELNGSGRVEAPAYETEKLTLINRGSGIINTEVQAQELSILLIGNGEIDLAGQAVNGDIKMQGTGELNAFGTHIENCNVEIYGECDVEISVSVELDVEIEGSGDVIYIGDPVVYEDIEGSGSVRKRDL